MKRTLALLSMATSLLALSHSQAGTAVIEVTNLMHYPDPGSPDQTGVIRVFRARLAP